MSIHQDHRQRVRARYESFGIDQFHEHELLELLLFYSIPRKDTNEIAHRLIKRFGSLERTLTAPIQELEKVEGMGHHSALFLKMLNDLEHYRQLHRDFGTVIMGSLQDCGQYLLPYFAGSKVEKVFLLCLDGKAQVLACREVVEGSVNAVAVSVRRIAEIALTEGASVVVLAHNHPSGVAIPSEEDIITTHQVERALGTIDVKLVDHIIVEGGEFVSMVQSGHFKPACSYVSMLR